MHQTADATPAKAFLLTKTMHFFLPYSYFAPAIRPADTEV